MEGKRRSESSKEDEIRKKIRKLEIKIKRRNRLRLPSTSSSSDNNEGVTKTSNETVTQKSLLKKTTDEGVILEPNNASSSPPAPPAPRSPSPICLPNQEIEPDNAPGSSSQMESIDVELDESILSLLGEAPSVVTVLGPPVHKDIALRLENIICKGLTEDVKKKLISDYSIPANIKHLVPPILNAEVKAALPENLIKRDFSIACRQKQIAAVLSALSTTMNMCLMSNQQSGLKHVSDACRLLHFNKNNFFKNVSGKSLNQKGPYRKPAVRADTGCLRGQGRAAPVASTQSYRSRPERRSPPAPAPTPSPRQRYYNRR